MHRRNFIKTTSLSNLGIIAVPTILNGTGWKGTNDRLNIAVIGIRGMGQGLYQFEMIISIENKLITFSDVYFIKIFCKD